jgi:hypothetical protein
MSGDFDIPLAEYVYSLRAEVEHFHERIHPGGAQIIDQWLAEMFTAARRGCGVKGADATAYRLRGAHRGDASVKRQLILRVGTGIISSHSLALRSDV